MFRRSVSANGASVGHRLVKVVQKDATISHGTEFSTMQKELGSAIGQRMNTIISRCAIEKWKVDDTHFHEEVREAFQVLNEACNKPEDKLPSKLISHLRNVLAGSPKDAGLGIDQQVLRHWALLPDEALKGLLHIIRAMLEGKCPLQALLRFM